MTRTRLGLAVAALSATLVLLSAEEARACVNHGQVCGKNGCCNLSTDTCTHTTGTTYICCGCGGRNCGDDGCGSSCGTCTAPQTCGGGGTAGVCGASCTPDCAGKNCGSDGCGGSCGTCTAPQACGGGGSPGVCGACTPSCSGKACGASDGCSGTCVGTCASGQCNPTTKTCDNCVGAGASCKDDTCCSWLATCVGSGNNAKCCAPSCNLKCGGDDGCGGTCPNSCPAGYACNSATSACESTCGGLNQDCCSTGSPCHASGLRCSSTTNQCEPCGALNQPCCTGATQCNPGIACVSDLCNGACGQDGADCSSDSPCCSEFRCVSSKCCVTDGHQTCCGDYCDQAYTCSTTGAGPGMHHFTAETLIIPMDSTYQAEGGVLKAYALVYRLLQEGILVYWVINPSKTTAAEGDFTLPDTADVGTYGWADSPPVRTALPGAVRTYIGGPFLISGAAHVIKAKRILDPSYNWQWRGSFTSVIMHSVMSEFDAPVSKAINQPPRKIALAEHNNNKLKGYLDQAFGSSTGVYDATTIGEIRQRRVLSRSRQVRRGLGLDGRRRRGGGGQIGAFIDTGKAYLAESDAIDSAEGTASGHFVSTNGLDCPNGGGHCDDLPGIAQPADPIAQIGDSEFHPQGGCSCWKPLAGSAWKPGSGAPADRVVHYLQNGTGYDSFSGHQKDDDPNKGWIFYLGGHSHQGQSENHMCAKRLIMNVLLSQTFLVRTTRPDREVARSGPVVDENAADSANYIVYQPTFLATCAQRTTFTDDATCAFQFPYYTGHSRAVYESALTSGTSTFDITGDGLAWDAAGRLSAQVASANTRPTGTPLPRWILHRHRQRVTLTRTRLRPGRSRRRSRWGRSSACRARTRSRSSSRCGTGAWAASTTRSRPSSTRTRRRPGSCDRP